MRHGLEHGTGRQRSSVASLATVCLMVVLVLLAYSNTLHTPFLFDDMPNVVENPYVRITELSPTSLSQAAVKSISSSRWLPNISLALNYYFGGMAVEGYHLVNITIHILCGIVLFYLAPTTLALLPRLKAERNTRKIAFFASLLWLLHPVQTNGVNYIVQRMTSLAALFVLLSLFYYIKGRTGNQPGRRLLFLLSSFIFGICALLSKENAIILPVMILGYEVFFIRNFSSRRFNKKVYYFWSLLLLLCVVFAIAVYFKGGNPFASILSGYGGRDFSLTERLLTQPRVIIHYVSLLFWPVPGRLNLAYDFAVSKGLFFPPATMLSLMGLLLLAASTFLLFRRNALLSFAFFWFLGNLTVESSVIPLEIIFEHRMYLPSIFAAPALTALFYGMFPKKERMVSVFLAVLVILLGLLTWQRNADWQSDISLWSDVVDKSPKLGRGYVNLGKALVEKGKYEKAQDILNRAISLDPEDGGAYINLALVYVNQNRLEKALLYVKKANEVKKNFNPAKTHQINGFVYLKQGDNQSAIAELIKSISFNPYSATTYVNLGIAYGRAGNSPKAEYYFREAASLDPNNGFALQNLGIELQKQGRLPEAVEAFQQALTKQLSDAAAIQHNLAKLYLRLQQNNRAMNHVEQSIAINPSDAQVYITKGRIYESIGKEQLAFQEYRIAWQRGFNMVGQYNRWAERAMLDNDPDRAAAYLAEALKLAPGDAVIMENLRAVRKSRQSAE